MPRREYERLKALLQTVLERLPLEHGRSSGFVQRASKVNAVRFVQMLVLSCWQERITKLADPVQVGQELGVTVSISGLHQRLSAPAVTLLRSVLHAALAEPGPAAAQTSAILQRFPQVYLQDSTQVTLPASLADVLAGSGGHASPAAAKVVLNYEYQSGTLAALAVVPGRTPDAHCGQTAQLATQGSLHLFDLGFYSVSLLQSLQAAQAYFLCRYHAQTALSSADGRGERLDLATLLHQQRRKQPAGTVWEFEACLGAQEQLPVRIIAVRLPPEVVAERRRRQRRGAQRRGRTPTAKSLALAEWNLFCTNVPARWWNAEQVAAAYRIRWQVELLFKLCKTQAGLDCIGNWRPPRVLCWLYAHLIALVLTHQLLASVRFPAQRELSVAKAFHLLQHMVSRWGRLLAHGWRGLRSELTTFANLCKAHALKEKRVRSPSTYQSLAALGA